MAFRWAAAALFALVGAGAARAESPEPPDPNYHNLRYEDDFSHPQAKSAADIFGPLKYVPIADGPAGRSYLTIGGEIRERFETYANPNFGLAKAPPSNHYLLQRLLLSADLHVSDYFRAFAQIGDMDRYGARGVPSTTDLDRGDLMQAFVDFRMPLPFGEAVARAGREELLFGWQRLIAVREGPNVRRAFDGFRLTNRIGDASLDLLAVRPVVDNQGFFDDASNASQRMTGGYLTTPVPFIQHLKTDLYLLNYENDVAKFRGLVGVEHRQTVGARLFGDYSGFDWNFEAANQSGSYRSFGIEAFLLAGVAGYRFDNLAWTPRLSLEANYASGDRGGATLGTFNAMFPRLPYFGELPLLVPSNVKDVRPVLTVDPVKNVQVVLSEDFLWRASTKDGLYGSGMSLFAGTSGAKVTGSKIGDETALDVRWRVDSHLSVGAIGSYMTAGPALAQASGKPVEFGVLYAKYKF